MKSAFLFASLALSTFAFASKVEVDVNGMSCGMCIEAITKELKATDKVENIHVNLEDRKTTFDEIKGKKISDHEIKVAIKKAGYDATKVRRR